MSFYISVTAKVELKQQLIDQSLTTGDFPLSSFLAFWTTSCNNEIQCKNYLWEFENNLADKEKQY